MIEGHDMNLPPSQASPTPPNAPDTSADAPSTDTTSVTPRSIVIVDNEPIVRDVLSSLLRTDGHHVRSASTAEETLRYLHAQLPDLILMDVQMPAVDGWQLLERIRTEFPPIPIVMMSDTRHAARARSLGAGFLAKPYRRDDIRQAITDAPAA